VKSLDWQLMSKSNKIIPELRFPEFRDSDNWDEAELGAVATLLKGKGISKSDVAKDGNLPCIRYGELYTYYNETIDHILSYTNLSPDKLILSEPNDVIIPSSGETEEDISKASCVLRSGIALGGDLNIIRSSLDGPFLSYYLNHIKKNDIAQLAQGIAVVHLYSSQLKKLRVHFPKLEEQEKIGSCLSSLDEMIAAHGQRLKLLKDHKKGLLQKLFPQEGEKVPKYRFPEFRCNVEWNISSLGDVVNFSSGGTPSKERPEYWNGTIPWISAASMHTYNIDKSESNITKLAVSHGAQVATEGTLLILVRGSMLHNRIPMGIALREVAFNQDVKALTLVKKMNIRFLLYELMALESQILNAVTATGIGAGKLDTNDLKKFTVRFPSADEQQKIAACLSSLDELIVAQVEKIEQLKLHKKGLMQGLFPKTIE
jgi:type I restriction enzyme S subunit